MTNPTGPYWQAGNYIQPLVNNPPQDQNASGARAAIWHFGRDLTLLVFPSVGHKWRAGDLDATDDGRHERGEPVEITIKGVWQPNSQKRGRGVVEEVSAGRSETNYVLHVDSHQQENIIAAAANPLIFPNGIRLVDFDELGTDGLLNFPMAIEYRGARYKIKQPLALFEGGDEELNTEGAIYRADCQLWRDTFHERDARGNAPVWGPRV